MRGIRRFSCRLSHHPVSCAQFTKMWNITGTRIHLNTRGTEPWAQGSLIPGSNYSAQVLLPPCASRARIAGARRCLAVPYVLRLCCSWLLWPGVAMPCFARALCGWRRQEGWVETEDFRLLTCEVCARLSSMRAPLPAGRPRGAQDRGHVKPLQQGSGMGHTQVPVPIRRHAASPSRHRLCLRLSTLGCTRCLLCAAEQSSRRGPNPAGASPAGRGKTRARMLSLI